MNPDKKKFLRIGSSAFILLILFIFVLHFLCPMNPIKKMLIGTAGGSILLLVSFISVLHLLGLKKLIRRILTGAASTVVFLIVFSITALLTCGCNIGNRIQSSGYTAWEKTDGTICKSIHYGSQKKERFDLYLPATLDTNKTHAVMLFIHGGAWIVGQRSDMDYVCKRYAKEGYITATMSYTLLKHLTRPTPGVNLTTMLDEIEACIKQIKTTTAEMGYKVDQLALSGYSAGGHLALLYAFNRYETSPLPIRFVFEQVGPIDFHLGSFEDDPKKVAQLASALSGTEVTAEQITNGQAEKTLSSLSPVPYIHSQNIPVLCSYGGKDWLVKPIHRKRLIAALEENKIPCQFIDFQNSDHLLQDDPDCRQAYHQAVLEFAKKYFGY